MIGNVTETMTKEQFNEEIDFLGANFDFMPLEHQQVACLDMLQEF